jgi:hypothetical protein
VIGLVTGCGSALKSEPTSVPIGSPRTPPVAIERDDLEAARRRVLTALDAGDLAAAASELAAPTLRSTTATSIASIVRAYDAPGPTRRSRVLANVTPLRVGSIPLPAARSTSEGKLVATRVKAPSGLQDAYSANDGRVFLERPSSPEKTPTWLPARLGDEPLRRLRASDGRWIALWGDRYVAILGGPTTELLDFGEWSERGPSERSSVEWADVAGDVLYVTTRRTMGDRFIAAIATRTGKPLWRSQADGFNDAFVIGQSSIVAWRYGASRGAPGELVTIRRDTGVTAARRTTPEIDSGDCHLIAAGGLVFCLASSSLWGGKGLKNDESLEIREPAPAARPPPPEPSTTSTTALATLPPPGGADARLAAWKLLEGGDPRAAIFALRTMLGERPTDVSALALDEIARAALETARESAGKEIVARHPPVLASETPSGTAPIHRTRTRRLVVASRKAITPDQMPSEFPVPTDEDRLAPAWVPQTIGNRGRNEDAGAVVSPTQRVEVYWGYGQPSMTVSFLDGKVTSVFEHPREVRASGAIGDVLLTVAGNGAWFLEAHDGKTGALYYRSKEELHDQYIVVEDGYVVASTAAKPSADIVLLEADTGKVVGRAHMPPPQDAFLIFRKDKTIKAVNMRSSVTLTLE